MTIEYTTIEGEQNERHVRLFALSTCGWCRKTKRFLENNDVAFEYVYVDQLSGADRQEARDAVREYNPRCSYPTVVIDGEAVVGFNEKKLCEYLDLD